MSALKRTADAQASLQEQFDRHKCEPLDFGQAPAMVTTDVLLHQGPDEEEDEGKTTAKKKMTMRMTKATATRSERARG
jgi:hypothetical protein